MSDVERKRKQFESSEPDYVFNWNTGTWTPKPVIELMRKLECEILYGVKDGTL